MNDDKLAQLSMHLREFDWLKCDVNPNVAFDSLNDKMLSLYNSICHSRQKKSNIFGQKRKPWLTHYILTSVKHKNKLYRQLLEKKTSECKTVYTKYTNILTATIRKSENLYYTQLFEKYSDNTRGTWRDINSILKTTRRIKI